VLLWGERNAKQTGLQSVRGNVNDGGENQFFGSPFLGSGHSGLSAPTTRSGFDPALWETFVSTTLGLKVAVLSSRHRLNNSSLAKCGCKKHVMDLHGNHTATCTAHSGATKAHDWMVSMLGGLFRTAGHTVRTQHGVTASAGQRRGDVEIGNYLRDQAGSRSLVFDLSISHDRYGSSSHVQQNGFLSHPQDLDGPLSVAAQRKINAYRQQYADNQNISFLPTIVSTSTRMHGKFLRLLFLQAHLETEAHFTATGMPSQQNSSASFQFKRAAFFQSLKSKVGLAAAKAAALRINLNTQGCGIVAPQSTLHAPPSFSPSSSHTIPFPPRSLVRGGQIGSHRPRLVVPHSTCPPISPSPPTNSFVIGTAIINTHRITPMVWGPESRGGERGIRYYCHKCRNLSKDIHGEKLETCPIPGELFTKGRLDAECPILRREVGREEFDEWMRKLRKGKSGGPDEMTYAMWQEAPDPMRELLWKSVNSVLAGSQLPEERTGAFTKLIVKKAGAEGALEDLRPVCLMSTAAKIITGIWAHRLSTTLEARGVLEDVQEGFRPDRSTKRQVMRLLNCINDAKRNGKKLIVAFLDFQNYSNSIGLACLFEILKKFGMAKEDVGILKQYYKHSYFQVAQESGEATARIRLQRGLRQGCPPRSPILGGVVVNALIRWLESKGGGYKHRMLRGRVQYATFCG
jgi:hypothetical protein